MRLRPLHDKVIVKPAPQVEQTASGLHLAEHRKPDQVGTVLALGPTATKSGAKPGDVVLFSWQSGQEVILDDSGTRVLIMLERDLLSVVGPETAIKAEEPIV